MARLDVEQYPSVAPTGAPGDDYQRIQTSPEMFGGAIARGEEKLGQGVENVGEAGLQTLTARQGMLNEVHGTELASRAADSLGNAYADFSQLQGKAAVDGRPAYEKRVDDILQQALSQAPSLQERVMVSRTLEYLGSRYIGMGAYHAKSEFTAYANKVATDQRQSSGAQALIAATTDDPDAVGHMNTSLYASDDAVRKYGEQSHWDQDTTNQEVAKNRGANLKNIVSALVNDGNLDKASLIFQANRGAIDAVSNAEITRILKAPLTARRVSTAASLATGAPVDPSHFEWTEKSAGLPIGYIGRTMTVESGMGHVPDRPGSQYQGPAQFGAAERAQYGITDPHSITQNAQALVHEAEDNAPQLTKVLGRQPTAAELYLAHQQGLGGAMAQLRNPDRPAWQNLAATSEGQRKGAAWARAAVWGNMTASAKAQFGSVDNVTGANFVGVVKNFYGAGGTAVADTDGIIDRPAAYQRAQTMFGNDPVFERQVESEIDRRWGEQRKTYEERTTAISMAMPNIVSAIADGHLEAEQDVPPDLALLGTKASTEWHEKVSAAKVLGARIGQLPMATPDQIGVMRDELTAGMGETSPLYKYQKDAVAAYDHAVAAREETLKKDPATYVLRNDANLKTAFDGAIKAGTPQAMQAFAQQMEARQNYLGVAPDQQRILPADYTASLAARWRDPARVPAPKPGEAGAASLVMAEMQSTAKLWGNYWPDVYHELAPKLDPVLRAVAAGGEPAALTKLLNDKTLPIGKILETEDDTKDSDLKKDVVDAIKPFAQTVSGSQRSQTIADYVDVTHRLAARYVTEGSDGETAAKQAAKDLLDYNYSFVDQADAHFRVPRRDSDGKPFPFSSDDIAAGADAARREITDSPRLVPGDTNRAAAISAMKLTPQETALYDRHLKNLYGAGGVDNADGSRSTLYEITAGFGNKTYVLPTVWDGKILPADQAIERAKADGLDKFPSYATEQEAEARYQQLHGYLEKDTAAFMRARALTIAPKADTQGRGLDDSYLGEETVDRVKSDSVWVTAPDEKGLVLFQPNGFAVRKPDGAPLFLSWADLAQRGRAKTAAMEHAASEAPVAVEP
ncbi:MAG TPA: hypothetical protein VHY10_20090 [Xanthobacteraceae bacterium]|jgi:hypothetical protein|nr:hypothetical protein [Xanthobacteraceae bacterium]